MVRIIDRQTLRASISAKEMVDEFHEWDQFSGAIHFALEPSERTVGLDRYGRVTDVYPAVMEDESHYDHDQNDELSLMMRGEMDLDPFDDDMLETELQGLPYSDTLYYP